MNLLVRGLALVLIVGAAFAAFLGYRLSQNPLEPNTPALVERVEQKAPEVLVVQTVRAVPAGQAIQREDLDLVSVAVAPKGSFAQPQLLVGKVSAMELAPKEILTSNHFKLDNPLLKSLHVGERAVAIKVDEVGGLAGFVKPGDRVDVLFYLQAAQETDQVTSAQVVLRNARVLAYGEDAGEDEHEHEHESDDDSKDKGSLKDGVSKAKDKVEDSQQRKQPRKHSSAVLAVSEQFISKLMLAASSGSLRLALRPLLDPLPHEDNAAIQDAGVGEMQRVAMMDRKDAADKVQFETLSGLARVRRIKDLENQKVQYVPVPVAVPMAAAASTPVSAPTPEPAPVSAAPTAPTPVPEPPRPPAAPPVPEPEPLLDVIIHEGEAVRHLSVPSL